MPEDKFQLSISLHKRNNKNYLNFFKRNVISFIDAKLFTAQLQRNEEKTNYIKKH